MYNKIFVLAPYQFASGGPELAHQLVDALRNCGQEAYIVYCQKKMIVNYDMHVTQEYKNYNVMVSTIIEDNENNMLIIPETEPWFIQHYKKIKIGFWWMSVDNYYKVSTNINDQLYFTKSLREKLRVCYLNFRCHYWNTKGGVDRLLEEGDRVIHFYQSHYAQFHCYERGFSQVLPLSDYINTEFLEENGETEPCNKENIILYNPAKGMEFTQKVIALLPEYQFVALKGFTRQQLNDIMLKAKLYIDFGNFPGKDRLPREAVLKKCCIITGKNGASRFYEDVAIPSKYKYETVDSQLPQIVNSINYVMAHYEESILDFDVYRKRIKQEKDIFNKEIETNLL